MLPLPGSAALRFETADKVHDEFQEVIVEMIEPIEELPFEGASKDKCRDPFLDDNRAGPVFVFVEIRSALPLHAKECPQNGRPFQMDGVREVEDVVKAVVILLCLVVGQAVAKNDAAALLQHVDLAADLVLFDEDLELPRQSFIAG